MSERKKVWGELYSLQVDQEEQLHDVASIKWIRGWERSGIGYDIPTFEDLNVPHWRIVPILGKSPEERFWYRLSKGIFNVNVRLRKREELEYLEERDYFHDVFGHIPILYDEQYSNYIRALGLIGQYMENTEFNRRALSNVYWFTSEFGLVLENGFLCAYGAGVLSSYSERKHALGSESYKIYIDVNLVNLVDVLIQIIEKRTYPVSTFQDEYVVLTSWDQLDEIIKFLWKTLV